MKKIDREVLVFVRGIADATDVVIDGTDGQQHGVVRFQFHGVPGSTRYSRTRGNDHDVINFVRQGVQRERRRIEAAIAGTVAKMDFASIEARALAHTASGARFDPTLTTGRRSR